MHTHRRAIDEEALAAELIADLETTLFKQTLRDTDLVCYDSPPRENDNEIK